jgi:hypothetical protein
MIDTAPTIRGQAPAGSNIISIDRMTIEPIAQAEDNKPVQDDSLRGTSVRGQAPEGDYPDIKGQTPVGAPAQGDAPVTVSRGQAPAGDPDSDVLPIEVVFHNMKNADCHPKDAKPADLAKLQKSAACIELARETEQLKLTYHGNQHVLDALADGRLR